MKLPFNLTISEDVIEKFKLALLLNKEEPDEVIEQLMMQYISNSFSKASQAYKTSTSVKPSIVVDTINIDTGKAMNRIPKWAVKPEQYNHKIVSAYFQVEKELGYVPLEVLEKRCSNEAKLPKTYVRDFRGNFNQMKFDGPKSHGKVFEVNGGIVVIWDYIKETLMEYKNYFCT